MIERILITGAAGSLGTALIPHLRGEVLATDKDTLDVTRRSMVVSTINEFEPTLVYHLAGAKYAPEGETDPVMALEVNAMGTRNVVTAAQGARVVTASTCKACDPETVYGASKLIAERLTLAAGGSVARFYNVRESCGNVFETWAALPSTAQVPITPCSRYFITLGQAIELLLQIPGLPAGRYTVNPGRAWPMRMVARNLYPTRKLVVIPPRRGDRLTEPRIARSEKLVVLGDGVERIVCAHDPDELKEAA